MGRLVVFPPGQRAACTAEFGWACALAGKPTTFSEMEGRVFGGTFSEAAQWLFEAGHDFRALVAVFTRGDGMETWLAQFPELCPNVPIVGGAAARGTGYVNGETLPHAADVALFGITEGTWRGTALTAHRPIGEFFKLAGSSPRRFDRIAGKNESLPEVLSRVRQENGLPPDDWDRIALTDRDGVVYHLHPEGETIVSGADLSASREVAAAVFSAAALDQARAGLNDNCLVFGCAGLTGLKESGLPWPGCGTFTALCGEIHLGGKTPRFSNLTLSVLERLS